MQIPTAIKVVEGVNKGFDVDFYETEVIFRHHGKGMHNIVEVTMQVKANIENSTTTDSLSLRALDIFVVFDINSGIYVDSYELQQYSNWPVAYTHMFSDKIDSESLSAAADSARIGIEFLSVPVSNYVLPQQHATDRGAITAPKCTLPHSGIKNPLILEKVVATHTFKVPIHVRYQSISSDDIKEKSTHIHLPLKAPDVYAQLSHTSAASSSSSSSSTHSSPPAVRNVDRRIYDVSSLGNRGTSPAYMSIHRNRLLDYRLASSLSETQDVVFSMPLGNAMHTDTVFICSHLCTLLSALFLLLVLRWKTKHMR